MLSVLLVFQTLKHYNLLTSGASQKALYKCWTKFLSPVRSYYSESFLREEDTETLVLTSFVCGLFEGSCYYYLLWRSDQFIDTLARAALGAIRDNDGL